MYVFFFFSSRRRHTICSRDWSSDVCSSDLTLSGSTPNVIYTPAANYSGPDSFTFKANDGTADSNIATVTISVTAGNDAPEIGRGAGRGRREDSGGGGSLKKKKKRECVGGVV